MIGGLERLVYFRYSSYLQPVAAAFGPGWAKKQALLDDCFRFSEESLEKSGKSIAHAFCNLVDLKYSFPARLSYFEPDGYR